jgi:hypothetical protein
MKTLKNGTKQLGGSASKIHLLVIPWRPIYNCVAFQPTDVDLIKHMHKMGVKCGRTLANKYTKIGNSYNNPTYNSERSKELYIRQKQAYAQQKSTSPADVNSSKENSRDYRMRSLALMNRSKPITRDITKNNFHFFTKFSNNVDGRFNQMNKYMKKMKLVRSTSNLRESSLKNRDNLKNFINSQTTMEQANKNAKKMMISHM